MASQRAIREAELKKSQMQNMDKPSDLEALKENIKKLERYEAEGIDPD